MVDRAVVDTVRRYLAALTEEGIHASRAVLFGSHARGQATEHSDVDLVVIAPEFDKPHGMDLIKTLWRATLAADYHIEPIACGEVEWETDGARPILEIARREGVVIQA